MIERYSRKEIRDIWEDYNKYSIWLDIELAAAEAMEKLKVIPNTEFQIEADLVLLAMGFTGPLIGNINNDNSFSLDNRGNISANTEDYKTSLKGIFSAGDMRRGQSLVVWAIREGRQAANSIDKYLMGETNLPR